MACEPKEQNREAAVRSQRSAGYFASGPFFGSIGFALAWIVILALVF
jgi:hypothetical protein